LIFSHLLLIPLIPVFQYSILYQLDLQARTLGIRSMPPIFRSYLYFDILSYVILIYWPTYWIFSQVLVIPPIPVFQYSTLYQPDLQARTLSIRSMPPIFRSSLYSNILSYVILIDWPTYWIFSQVLVIPIIPVFQYSILYQPDLHTQTLSIRSMLRLFWSFLYFDIQSYVILIDWPTYWIFSQISFIPTIPVFQYSILYQSNLHTHTLIIRSMLRLFQLFIYFNIQLYVDWPTYSIFSHLLATPIIPVFQYSILYQPDLHTHTLSIDSILRPFQLFLYANIQSRDSLIDWLTYWIFSHVSVFPTIPVF
jgi:hypothetical protein